VESDVEINVETVCEYSQLLHNGEYLILTLHSLYVKTLCCSMLLHYDLMHATVDLQNVSGGTVDK